MFFLFVVEFFSIIGTVTISIDLLIFIFVVVMGYPFCSFSKIK